MNTMNAERLKKIKIVEYFLLLNSLVFFAIYFSLLLSSQNWYESFIQEIKNVSVGIGYFEALIVFSVLVLIFELFVWFSKTTWRILSTPREKRKYLRIFSPHKIIELPSFVFPFLKIALGSVLLFSFFAGILGVGAEMMKGRVINNQMMDIDRVITGKYVFLWLQGANNPFRFFDASILYSFDTLGIILSLVFLIFYIYDRKGIFNRYVISILLAVILSLPLWFVFPSNSPQNAFLNLSSSVVKIGGEEFPYKPTALVSSYQKKISDIQKEMPPISTMPSMHVAWSIIIAYLAFSLNKRFAMVFMVWAFFSILGTIYLAQHYFIDVLAAILIATFSLLASSLMVRIEKKYYYNPGQDAKEKRLKDKVKKDIKSAKDSIKFLFGVS